MAARSWNDIDGADCVLPYYKQFLWTDCLVADADCKPSSIPGFVVNSPPIPRSCIEPTRWRNTQCLNGTFGPDEVVSDLSVESDWMGFYYGLTKPQTQNRFTVPELADLYIAPATAALPACWRSVPAPVERHHRRRRGALHRRAISNDQRQQLLAHGASTASARTPRRDARPLRRRPLLALLCGAGCQTAAQPRRAARPRPAAVTLARSPARCRAGRRASTGSPASIRRCRPTVATVGAACPRAASLPVLRRTRSGAPPRPRSSGR